MKTDMIVKTGIFVALTVLLSYIFAIHTTFIHIIQVVFFYHKNHGHNFIYLWFLLFGLSGIVIRIRFISIAGWR